MLENLKRKLRASEYALEIENSDNNKDYLLSQTHIRLTEFFRGRVSILKELIKEEEK